MTAHITNVVGQPMLAVSGGSRDPVEGEHHSLDAWRAQLADGEAASAEARTRFSDPDARRTMDRFAGRKPGTPRASVSARFEQDADGLPKAEAIDEKAIYGRFNHRS